MKSCKNTKQLISDRSEQQKRATCPFESGLAKRQMAASPPTQSQMPTEEVTNTPQVDGPLHLGVCCNITQF